MKAITVKQPWASLIALGIKPIENRTWKLPEKYKGQTVLIHASASWDQYADFTDQHLREMQEKGFKFEKCVTGVIIGSVKFTDCVINHPSIWAEKSNTVYQLAPDETDEDYPKPIYNWVLANPIIFPEPIRAKGKLSFWDYPNILAEPEEKNGELFCHCQLTVNEENQVSNFDGRHECRYCGGK